MICLDILNVPQNYSIETSRENIIKALEGFNRAIDFENQNPEDHEMYGIGGTALGGSQTLELVEAPYLPELDL